MSPLSWQRSTFQIMLRCRLLLLLLLLWTNHADENVMDLDRDAEETVLPQTNGLPQEEDSETPIASSHVVLFPSIQALYDTIQKQQQQQTTLPQERSMVYWMILLQEPSCSTDHVTRLYERAVRQVQDWNRWYDDVDEGRRKMEEMPPYIDTGRLILEHESDKSILLSQLGLTWAPAILLLSTSRSSKETEAPIFVVEYSGPARTATEMAQGVRHYFDTLALHSVPAAADPSNNPNNPLLMIRPRPFASFSKLQQFLVTYAERLFGFPTTADEMAEEAYLEPHPRPHSNRPVLSRHATTLAERRYIEFLWEPDISASSTLKMNDSDFVLLLLQCRWKEETSKLYREFDQMAQALQARRDRLFLVVHPEHEHDRSPCTMDGMVLAYEIPNRNLPFDYLRGLLLTPFDKWSNLFVHYPYHPALPEEEEEEEESRLVEFLVKVCTDNVMWFDRQLVAPIAFPKYRPIHVVLVVNMHQEILSIATATSEVANGTDDSTLAEHPLSIMQRRAVTDLRRLCRNHRLQHPLLDQDIVCLIVPSTETRILSTMGMVDLWWRADEAIEQYVRGEKDKPSQITFPSILITDQRFGGTRRYYKEFVKDYYKKNSDTSENPIQDYFNAFWSGQLTHIVKSGPPPKYPINDDGVRTLTANTIESILFGTDQTFHALVLFTVASCGHCKRFWIIWNRLSRLVRSIEWNSFLHLYFIDVSENDILSTELNVSVPAVPTVYYLSPDRLQRIRYNITDELGDGLGSVREVSEILDWLVNDVGDAFMDPSQIESLLRDLEAASERLTGKG